MADFTVPGSVQCYKCGRPADSMGEDKSKSNTNKGYGHDHEEYICYVYKCVNCGEETLRCFRGDGYR